MSIPMLAVPAQATVPVTQAIANYARSLFKFGALVSLFLIFKPLAIGMMRAVLLAFKPRPSLERRAERKRMRDVMMLNRMARECEGLQPSQADEFRSMAARDW